MGLRSNKAQHAKTWINEISHMVAAAEGRRHHVGDGRRPSLSLIGNLCWFQHAMACWFQHAMACWFQHSFNKSLCFNNPVQSIGFHYIFQFLAGIWFRTGASSFCTCLDIFFYENRHVRTYSDIIGHCCPYSNKCAKNVGTRYIHIGNRHPINRKSAIIMRKHWSLCLVMLSRLSLCIIL